MRYFIVLILSLWLTSIASAQVIYNFGAYGQSFDTLSNAGSANTWTNNSTIIGWYANEATYQADDGSGNTGGLYSFGTTASNERALGSIANSQHDPVLYAVQIFNNTASTFTTINISFTGEQWRNGGGNNPNTITFSWLLTTSNTNQLTSAGYTNETSLDWTTQVNAPPSSALDGNLAANQQLKSASLLNTIVFQPGQYLWLRWTDINDNNPDAGTALDGFVFSASVPEVSTMFGAGLGIALLGGLYFRRKTNAVESEAVETLPEGKYEEFPIAA